MSHRRPGPGRALYDHVVAAIADQRVVARAADQPVPGTGVGAVGPVQPADQKIVAAAAEQDVAAEPAGQSVVAALGRARQIADQDVVAGAALGNVVAVSGPQPVVAVAAEQRSAPVQPRITSLPAPPFR